MKPIQENKAHMMFEELKSNVKEQKLKMLQSGTLTIDKQTMKFVFKKIGKKPFNGYPLIFGFHGGGGCPPEVNDSQYQNHKNLYDKFLPPCIWFVPRSC